MKCWKPLIALVTQEQNIVRDMYAALLKKLNVVNGAIRFGDANNLSGSAVYDNLVFYRMAFLLAGVGFALFF